MKLQTLLMLYFLNYITEKALAQKKIHSKNYPKTMGKKLVDHNTDVYMTVTVTNGFVISSTPVKRRVNKNTAHTLNLTSKIKFKQKNHSDPIVQYFAGETVVDRDNGFVTSVRNESQTKSDAGIKTSNFQNIELVVNRILTKLFDIDDAKPVSRQQNEQTPSEEYKSDEKSTAENKLTEFGSRCSHKNCIQWHHSQLDNGRMMMLMMDGAEQDGPINSHSAAKLKLRGGSGKRKDLLSLKMMTSGQITGHKRIQEVAKTNPADSVFTDKPSINARSITTPVASRQRRRFLDLLAFKNKRQRRTQRDTAATLRASDVSLALIKDLADSPVECSYPCSVSNSVLRCTKFDTNSLALCQLAEPTVVEIDLSKTVIPFLGTEAFSGGSQYVVRLRLDNANVTQVAATVFAALPKLRIISIRGIHAPTVALLESIAESNTVKEM